MAELIAEETIVATSTVVIPAILSHRARCRRFPWRRARADQIIQ